MIVKLVKPLKPTDMGTACPNCKARLSCGCQKRKASNGAAVCTNCVSKYEASISIAKNAKPPQTNK